jgi:hypothetical protein
MPGQQETDHTRGGRMQDNLQMPGVPQYVEGGGSGTVNIQIPPEAMKFMQEAPLAAVWPQGSSSGPHSSDMIPAIRGLAQLDGSNGSSTDVTMTAADSILGKRLAEENEVQGEKLVLSLGLDYGAPVGGTQKRGKTGADDGQRNKKEAVVDSMAGRTRRRIATGHTASDNLTRPNGGACQAK